METVVAVEKREEFKFEDSEIAKISSQSQKQIADPIVYKLVRVEGDGKLVAATDDEVIEVEDLLDNDKNEMHFVVNTGQIAACTSNDDFFSDETTSNGSEGLLISQNSKADEERTNAPLDTAVELGKLNAQFEEIVPSSALTSDDGHVNHSGVREHSDPPFGFESEPSTSTCASWKPNLSILKGEICLDDLSVKELHETFKATFGRETSVKDKQWLKRRIAMGLSNSCDVSTTTFIIEDNRVIKKDKVENSNNMDATLTNGPVVGGINDTYSNISVGDKMENRINVSSKRVQSAKMEYNLVSEDLHTEQRAAKRVRKPTRRYIEEVSEVECKEYSGKFMTSDKNSGHGQSSPRARFRPVQNLPSFRRPLVTRQDSLGGSGVQIPYVSRIRRGRPRENFMALMKLQPCGMGVAAKLVKKALGQHDTGSDCEIENKVFKDRLPGGWVEQPLTKEPEEDEQYLEQKSIELEHDVDSSTDNSDDNIVTVPTPKGGMRRKHHRPWTLTEVVKLVEGVARYGAGRWSEIKRISFATYSYRTSVDLKDKWRNLLRASFAQLPVEKGQLQNSRKHSSIPIPAPILSRVRELAEMQSQDTPGLSSIKFPGHSGRSVHEVRPGYL